MSESLNYLLHKTIIRSVSPLLFVVQRWETVDSAVALLKEIVHLKMKTLSSSTQPQVVPNLYECLCSAEHKQRYSEESGKQSSSGAPLTSGLELLEVEWMMTEFSFLGELSL